MRLHEPVVGRRNRHREQPLELEMRLEHLERALGVRDETDLHTGCVNRAKHLRDVLVEREMMALRPLVVDVPGRFVYPGAGSAHSLDDPSSVANEDGGIVSAPGGVEGGRGSRNRRVESRLVYVDSVPPPETATPDPR